MYLKCVFSHVLILFVFEVYLMCVFSHILILFVFDVCIFARSDTICI